MPMWICWSNFHTQRPERIYNYFDLGTPEGEKAIKMARRALSTRFGVPQSQIPGFKTEEAQWISLDARSQPLVTQRDALA